MPTWLSCNAVSGWPVCCLSMRREAQKCIYLSAGHWESLSRVGDPGSSCTALGCARCSIQPPRAGQSWALHLKARCLGWTEIDWQPLAQAEDRFGWCSTNCWILGFSDRSEVASLWWVSCNQDSSWSWHLSSASERNTETPQLSQAAHSHSEIYSVNFHLLLVFTNRSWFSWADILFKVTGQTFSKTCF